MDLGPSLGPPLDQIGSACTIGWLTRDQADGVASFIYIPPSILTVSSRPNPVSEPRTDCRGLWGETALQDAAGRWMAGDLVPEAYLLGSGWAVCS